MGENANVGLGDTATGEGTVGETARAVGVVVTGGTGTGVSGIGCGSDTAC